MRKWFAQVSPCPLFFSNHGISKIRHLTNVPGKGKEFKFVLSYCKQPQQFSDSINYIKSHYVTPQPPEIYNNISNYYIVLVVIFVVAVVFLFVF